MRSNTCNFCKPHGVLTVIFNIPLSIYVEFDSLVECSRPKCSDPERWSAIRGIFNRYQVIERMTKSSILKDLHYVLVC